MLAFRLLVVGLVIGLAGCNSPAVPSGAQYATIYGTVVDAATGKPISGATVTIDQIFVSSPTADDGAYSVGNIPSGPFSYSASAPGYQAKSENGSTVTPGLRLSLTITLNK